MLGVQRIEQEKPYWCGPAALQMVLGFFGVHESQEHLAELLKSTELNGTDEEMMEKVARDLGFDVSAGEGSYEDILTAVNEGTPVIVVFLEPRCDEGHYAIVIEANDHIVLIDPEGPTDPYFHMTKEAFIERWMSKYAPQKRWMMVLRKKQ